MNFKRSVVDSFLLCRWLSAEAASHRLCNDNCFLLLIRSINTTRHFYDEMEWRISRKSNKLLHVSIKTWIYVNTIDCLAIIGEVHFLWMTRPQVHHRILSIVLLVCIFHRLKLTLREECHDRKAAIDEIYNLFWEHTLLFIHVTLTLFILDSWNVYVTCKCYLLIHITGKSSTVVMKIVDRCDISCLVIQLIVIISLSTYTVLGEKMNYINGMLMPKFF